MTGPRRPRRHGRHRPTGRGGPTSPSTMAASSASARPARRARRDRRDGTARAARASSTCTSTSTSRAGPSGRARPPAAAHSPPAAARCSSTCRSTRHRARVNARELRPQAHRARGVVDHRLRPVGRAGPRHRSATWRRWPQRRRRRLQGVHVRLGPAGVSARRRRDAVRGDARSRAAGAAGRRARRKRGD